jgi:preprotein translocase subunit YajC
MTLASLLLFAPPPGSGGDSRMIISFMVQMGLIFAIVYFMMIRPRMQTEKKHRERLGLLKKGDEIVTTGGVIGEVIHLKDDRITIKSGESRLVIQRDRISDIRAPALGEGTAAS